MKISLRDNGVTRILLLLSSLLVACEPETRRVLDREVVAVGSQGEALYGKTGSYWPADASGITVIPVCWTTANSNSYKTWVRQTVEEQWDNNSSVRFTGWDACNANTPVNAIRIKEEDSNARSYVGVTSENPSMYLNFTFANWSQSCNDAVDDAWAPGDDREYCIRVIALHEFGHALGFYHEQDSPENTPNTPGYCNNTINQQPDGQVITQYDPDSSMSYCAQWNRKTLSTLDVQGLRKIYGVAPVEFRSQYSPFPSACTLVNEPADYNHGWADNYLCTAGSEGVSWHNSGLPPLLTKRCTQITEVLDLNGWLDNYICVPTYSPLQFTYSSLGPVAGMRCASWNEPADPNNWENNYLCYTQRLAFSPAGKIMGTHCAELNEPNDPDGWKDNFLCTDQAEGLAFSATGTIAGKRCTLVDEPNDSAHGWGNNYICVSTNSTLQFQWSNSGPIANKTCVAWNEPLDSAHGWSDNYLCY
ncbi:hypothetical protein JRI60_08065 [Archangium violaceum]|uniref:hypothetical protein n=1 Tax=Archangium violaceum TaxID=83451 RepID=UPI001952712B|nr:hypothetical protein [Archangium violaceum]QRN98971.1 hypothetical protein JRI60_08065 [Archangium violaceum]